MSTFTPQPHDAVRRNLLTGAVLLGTLLVGSGAYYAGRRSAPTETAPNTSHEEHEEGGGEAEGESHGHEEEGHDEHEGEGHSDTIAFDAKSAQLAGIKLRTATLSAATSRVPFNGQIAPNLNGVARVTSLVPGRITRLNVSQGDVVTQGQVLGVIDSRAVGEAQSAYRQALARYQNALSNRDVVLKQAKAGVFSRAPLEVARRAQVEAQAEVATQASALRQAQIAKENVLRQAKLGVFSSPALESARAQNAAAAEAHKKAEAALDNARVSVDAAQHELERRRQLASGGAYVSRPVDEAKRSVVMARSSRNSAQSEVVTTRANLSRAKSLAAEGLISQRELEAAQQAFDSATARLESSQSDETTAEKELERQQKLASSNVSDFAEISAAQSTLAAAQADVRSREAELNHARESMKLAGTSFRREQAAVAQNIANRREVSVAQTAFDTARNSLLRARQNLVLANATYRREQRILRENLNNIAQVQSANSAYNAARAELSAARTTLVLFKSSPNGSAQVPVRAPIAGVVQSRSVTMGETIAADAPLFTLINLHLVAVEAAIYEKDFATVRIGAPVEVKVDSFPNRTFQGNITFLSSQLDPETRTLTARAMIRNSGKLRPGMFARGSISTASGQLAVTVPAGAVQNLEGKNVIFVPTTKNHEFKATPVVTGPTASGLTVIRSGLKLGEKYVNEGAFVVKSQALKSELAGHSHG